jgi:hypothetical protein
MSIQEQLTSFNNRNNTIQHERRDMKNRTLIILASVMGLMVFGCMPSTPTPVSTAFIPPTTDVPVTEQVPTQAPTTEPASPTQAPTTEPAIPAGWLLYTNPYFGYQFYYPPEATITESGVVGFPTDELPAGKTADEYMTELQAQYGDTLCVGVSYGSGYVNISAPDNTEFRYALCGRTGVGVGTMTDKSESITIAGSSFTATGYEFEGDEDPCDMLPCHNETMVLQLSDDTRIEYSASPVDGVTYADYVSSTKPVLVQIVQTFVPGP